MPDDSADEDDCSVVWTSTASYKGRAPVT